MNVSRPECNPLKMYPKITNFYQFYCVSILPTCFTVNCILPYYKLDINCFLVIFGLNKGIS